jgi:hypothetical protein
LTIAGDRIEARRDYGERGSQFVRRIGREASLNHKALLQPVERVIDGDDQRERFGWHIGVGQA